MKFCTKHACRKILASKNFFVDMMKIGILRWLSLILTLCFSFTLAHASAPKKILRTVIPAAETGFDPVAAHDLYSAQVISSIYETLFTYDYLARPVKLIPLTAAALPHISNDGKTWTIRIKKHIYFSTDPAFKGKPRELTAADYIYAIKRLVDPKVRSAWSWLIAGKIVGLGQHVQQAKETGKFDYHTPVAGLEQVDRYTLRIRLHKPDYNLGQILAHTPTSAVAREIVERYQDANGHIMTNPVGTGPYLLAEWQRGAKMILESNPQFRGITWDFQASNDGEDTSIIRNMKGKTLPQIDRVEIHVIPEDQSRWLAFQNNEVDIFNLDGPLAPRALKNGQLRDALRAKGVQLSRLIEPELSHTYFNMRNPTLGGLSKEKIALRRAIAMAHDIDATIKLLWNGQAIRLEFPIPPGVVGHDPDYVSSVKYDPKTANALLDHFGYKINANGWRTLPDGAPLLIRFSVRAGSVGQLKTELWKKTFDSLHIQMQSDTRPFPDMLKAEKQCQLMMRTSPWIADYPDGDNFTQLFYGKNVGKSNNGCMKIPEYDRIYEAAKQLPAGEERQQLYRQLARIMEFYAPTMISYARYRNMLIQPHVLGYKKHPVMHNEWIYLDIAPQQKNTAH